MSASQLSAIEVSWEGCVCRSLFGGLQRLQSVHPAPAICKTDMNASAAALPKAGAWEAGVCTWFYLALMVIYEGHGILVSKAVMTLRPHTGPCAHLLPGNNRYPLAGNGLLKSR